jgi:hypothetical protein
MPGGQTNPIHRARLASHVPARSGQSVTIGGGRPPAGQPRIPSETLTSHTMGAVRPRGNHANPAVGAGDRPRTARSTRPLARDGGPAAGAHAYLEGPCNGPGTG